MAPHAALRGRGRRIVGLPLIGLGAAIAFLAYREWVANERALRLKEPLPPSRLPLVVSAVVMATGGLALLFAALGRAG